MQKLGNNRNVVLLSLLLFGLVLAVFWPSLRGTFLFYDESAYIEKNPHVNTGLSWANIHWAIFSLEYANWHPVTWFSHMLDCQLFGLNPWGHHLTNILIHAANAALVFIVFRKLTGATALSFIVALLFGLHPLRVASATYISERRDVLSLFFWMLTIWAYAAFTEAPPGKKARLCYAGALLFFILGLMSKSMLVTLPFVLLLLDHWPLNRWARVKPSRLVLEKLPFFALTISVCILAYVAQNHAGMMREMADSPFSDKLGNAVISYVRYLGKLFWPAGLNAYYPHPGHWPTIIVFLSVAFIGLVSATAWYFRKRLPWLMVGWFWYLGTPVPVIGLVQLLSQSIADRYTYIPMIGVLLALVWGAKELTTKWWFPSAVLPVLVALAVGACIVRTRAEISYYHDDLTLWRRTIAVTENNSHAHYALGTFLKTTDVDRAMDEFQEAVRINPRFIGAQNDLGCYLVRKGRPQEALVHFAAILQVDPTNGNCLFNCSVADCLAGNLDEAIDHLKRLQACEPDNQKGVKLYHTCLQIKSKTDEVVKKLRATLQEQPDQLEVINALAWVLATTPDASIRNAPEAVRLATRTCEMTHHQTTVCLGTLAAAYAATGRFDEAITTGETALANANKNNQANLIPQAEALLAEFRAHKPHYDFPVMDLDN